MKHDRDYPPKREVWVQTYAEPTVALVRFRDDDRGEIEVTWSSFVVLPSESED